ncbi:hypothetical protein CBM2592_A280134 [Cupriavidus taiwanensis]|nr:hypothetical protein CBM2592_A280134 [Cupriavidus taiwanensis]SOY85793.1 hypothetical protein CBM2591_A320133 [Cupriavidus taiwanensis]SPA15665.1 hypothetical protein CBM2631_A330001 [Cupriavidus taiwanensis]SPD44903.1 protein of unknown function [Cupriavidus taiwanensis]
MHCVPNAPVSVGLDAYIASFGATKYRSMAAGQLDLDSTQFCLDITPQCARYFAIESASGFAREFDENVDFDWRKLCCFREAGILIDEESLTHVRGQEHRST